MTSCKKCKVILEQVPYEIEQKGDLIVVNGQEFTFKMGNTPGTATVSGNSHTFNITKQNATVDGISYPYEVQGLEEPKENKKRKTGSSNTTEEAGAIVAVMPGLIIKILKNVGDSVVAGETVIILEAMKMQNELKATQSGVIKQLKVKQGESVEMRQVLAVVG